MYIKIFETEEEYTALNNLEFSPQVDLVCDALPINEFSVDILTDDDIDAGNTAQLLDDNDTLWASYQIDYAERVDANTVHVRARSEVALLDGVTLSAKMYDEETLGDVLDEVMVRQSGATGIVAAIDYILDNSLNDATVSGYCPQQTARERLQWVCFACGAYVKTAFVSNITILPLDNTETLIPIGKTFWKPTVNHGDYVTAVKMTSYTFAQDADAASNNNSYTFPLPWVATTRVYSLENEDVPAGIQENNIEIDKMYLINPSNVTSLLSILSSRYFKRTKVIFDCINNGKYHPGDKVAVFVDDNSAYSGYIEETSFKFGHQARSTIKLTSVTEVSLEGIEWPDEIRVTTQPYNNNAYMDGTKINYFGMVVKGYKNNLPWTNRWYPDGVIPMDELILQEYAHGPEQYHTTLEGGIELDYYDTGPVDVEVDWVDENNNLKKSWIAIRTEREFVDVYNGAERTKIATFIAQSNGNFYLKTFFIKQMFKTQTQQGGPYVYFYNAKNGEMFGYIPDEEYYKYSWGAELVVEYSGNQEDSRIACWLGRPQEQPSLFTQLSLECNNCQKIKISYPLIRDPVFVKPIPPMQAMTVTPEVLSKITEDKIFPLDPRPAYIKWQRPSDGNMLTTQYSISY